MKNALASILGLGLASNGVWMLARPASWYLAIPGVTETGPANMHFIRDIGCAYLVAGLGLLWLVARPAVGWPAAFAGGGFLALHAIVHAWDAAAGREQLAALKADLPTVFLPAAVALWLAWPRGRGQEMEK
jgi:uncharacterized protein YjeT (DUF2065 family)